MPTATLSIHGGKHCNSYCRWDPSGYFCDLGPDDGHMMLPADRAVIALDEVGHLIGAWFYDKLSGDRISSCGTWVLPLHRKKGIAKKLWEFGILYENPKKVIVTVITDRGYSLINSMKDKFPLIKWSITENADRMLRKL